MINYFEKCPRIEDIRSKFRELAFAYHPDRGGDTAIMQEINAQYLGALKAFHGTKTFTRDNKEYEFKYNETLEREIIEKLQAILSTEMAGVDVLLIGNWIWVVGATRPYKDTIKSLGFKWHRDKSCWFYHVGKWRGKGGKKSLEDIADTYGYKKYAANLRNKIVYGA